MYFEPCILSVRMISLSSNWEIWISACSARRGKARSLIFWIPDSLVLKISDNPKAREIYKAGDSVRRKSDKVGNVNNVKNVRKVTDL
jgi:hypothetical protein